MSHALMYYLANRMEERRQKLENEQKKQVQVHPGLVFISPRVSKEFDTVVPSDTNKQSNTTVSTDEWCVIA